MYFASVTRYCVVSVRIDFLFLSLPGEGLAIRFWHSPVIPYDYFEKDALFVFTEPGKGHANFV